VDGHKCFSWPCCPSIIVFSLCLVIVVVVVVVEVEPVVLPRSFQSGSSAAAVPGASSLSPAATEPAPVIGYQPTYRAVLAKRGYLVRNTLGSGSYSKV